MSNQKQDSQDLQDYLSGNSDLSNLHRSHSNESSPEHLDNLILSAARKNAGRQKNPGSPFSMNWMIPVSLAAVLVLAISIVPLTQEPFIAYDPAIVSESALPGTESKEQAYADKSRSAEQMPARQSASPAPAKTVEEAHQKPKMRLQEKPSVVQTEEDSAVLAKEETHQPAVTASRKKAAAPMMESMAGLTSSYPDQNPEQWIEQIRELLKHGKLQEARASLKNFTQRYPDYPVAKTLGEDYRVLVPDK